jgi:Asp-tRNA(Asn)/Glu-tRNA(Gln) amidotransferase B subunit
MKASLAFAVISLMMAGCAVHEVSVFERKTSFYPYLP